MNTKRTVWRWARAVFWLSFIYLTAELAFRLVVWGQRAHQLAWPIAWIVLFINFGFLAVKLKDPIARRARKTRTN